MDVTVEEHKTQSRLSNSFSRGHSVMNRYTVQEKLGSGSFATAYLVTDAKDGGSLKVLKRISCGGLRPDSTLPSAREAKLLGSLRHPFIVQFFSSFLEKEDFCIITEYCEGGDLDCIIQQQKDKNRPFPEGHITEWFIQLLLGVNYLHERLVLHRDLKTKNIFLKNGTIKIGDFGVSRILSLPTDMATSFTGTPHYMSPETFSNSGYNSKSDIWSLGCILYEICCFQYAFEASNWIKLVSLIVEGPTPCLPSKYSAALNDILQRTLRKDPEERPSASEILTMPYIVDRAKVLSAWLEDVMGQDGQGSVSDDACRIAAAVKEKLHLDTLRAMHDIQEMDPRQRRRIRKDEPGETYRKKMKRAVERLYQENHKKLEQGKIVKMRQENAWVEEESTCTSADIRSYTSSEDDEESEEEEYFSSSILSLSTPLSEEHSSTLSAYQSCLRRFLDYSTNANEVGITDTISKDSQDMSVSTCNKEEIARLRQVCLELLGENGFWKVYDYLKREYFRQDSETEEFEEATLSEPQEIGLYPQHCHKVQQLIFLEERMEGQNLGMSCAWL
ncbi:serine threonine- kinase Nek11 isoform X1 [Pelobates cultripes]|uniref:non-specific serine/threonine protein kinase n=1 Tax=Pelobates cultripes TaxID=61616 RepID=A0AAD1TDC4_PELCU|nr:serine threonine- kinase Nek11 isoform X1 [Pelobates cultripes]